ncbi:ArgR family transcriptional regulator [Thalassotalea sp. 1_MG-2023]|uniref:ArgR family transcriptional regulator n=1 Tax=Thalassotalea sp. 1_MG-2023 TaxID=3062680 RepID=UPI0026E268B4|nr:ArgR family transcriptional regulator [Thalassotalea sp. 1_MG-2023]
MKTFRKLLSDHHYNSQQSLIDALAKHGFCDISQAKISRMLSKVGAIKIRNEKNVMVYQLPSELNTPKTKQSINSMVLKITHNQFHIVVKTIIGGGSVIARILDTMEESLGVLATIADDNTVLVIPSSVEKIDQILLNIIEQLEISEYH